MAPAGFGSATTVHTTGIDLGSGNITSHNINSTGIITATSFVGPVTGNITGDITATSGTFSGNVSIGGTLTYEDVTNIDSVGIVTCRSIILSGSTGTAGQFVVRRDSDGANIGQFRSDSGTDDISIGNGGGGGLILKTGSNTERVRITSSGQFSVGPGSFIVESDGDISTNVRGHGHIELDSTGTFSSPKVKLFSNTGNAEFAGTISDSIGPLRRLGINAHNAATYTLVAGDAGKLVREATNGANITIPQNVFSAGDMISIFNVSGGDNTITQGTGTTLYNTGDGATGNRTLAAKGVCTIVCTDTNEFIISGSQVS